MVGPRLCQGFFQEYFAGILSIRQNYIREQSLHNSKVFAYDQSRQDTKDSAQHTLERLMGDPNWLEAFAAVAQVVIAVAQFFLAYGLWHVAKRQTQAQNVEALRDVFAVHHSPEMRAARELIRKDLPTWLQGKSEEEARSDPEFPKFKRAFEDTTNYYEYLGMIMKLNPYEKEIILEMAHNSAVAIWQEVMQPYVKLFRGNIKSANDYAGNFAHLVEEATKYRRQHRLA